MRDEPRDNKEPLLNNLEFLRAIHDVVQRFSPQMQNLLLSSPLQADEMPLVLIIDRQVICLGRLLDLSRKPSVMQVFRAFCLSESLFVTSEHLLRHIYDLKDLGEYSERYLESLHNNVVKMVSRARIEANISFGRRDATGWEWFAYDPYLKGWHFCRQRPKRRLVGPRVLEAKLPTEAAREHREPDELVELARDGASDGSGGNKGHAPNLGRAESIVSRYHLHYDAKTMMLAALLQQRDLEALDSDALDAIVAKSLDGIKDRSGG